MFYWGFLKSHEVAFPRPRSGRVHQLGDLGGRCMLPRGVQGRSPWTFLDFGPSKCLENAFPALKNAIFSLSKSCLDSYLWCNSERTKYASIAAEGIVGAVSPQRGAAYLCLFCYSERLEIAFSAHKFDIKSALILLNTSCFIIKNSIVRSLFI